MPGRAERIAAAHKHIVHGGVSEEITMEMQTAVHIIGTLAQGIDPHTGEQFPTDSPYQHPDTVRALFQAAQALSGIPGGRSRAAASGIPENAGKPWNDEEDKVLAAAFDAGKPIPELAREHRRTRAAIQARLVRLGRIEPSADMPRYRNLLPTAQAA
jgi:hypothetical protein